MKKLIGGGVGFFLFLYIGSYLLVPTIGKDIWWSFPVFVTMAVGAIISLLIATFGATDLWG